MPLRVLDPDYEDQAATRIRESVSPNGVLEQVTYTVPLPELLDSTEDNLPCHEPAEETAAISAHMSARIHAFFEQLAKYHSSDAAKDKNNSVTMSLCIAKQTFSRLPFCSHRKYHSRRLQLNEPSTLPDLPFISNLAIHSEPDYSGDHESYGIRPLSPLVVLRCLTHLPNIQSLNVPWLWERPMPCSMPSRVMREHYTRPWEGPLRDARHEFGNAILSPDMYLHGGKIPESLTHVALHFWTPKQIGDEDQAVKRPNLILPAGRDPVSVGLCVLGRQLQVFDVRVLITEDLFPGSKEKGEGERWAEMRKLRVEFHPLRPDGSWYFLGPRGEGSEGGFEISKDEDYPREFDTEEDAELDDEWEEDPGGGEEVDFKQDMFRTEPCRERVEPLLKAFAMAVAKDNMPNLEVAELFAYLWWCPSDSRAEEYCIDREDGTETKTHRWGVKYLAGRSGGDGEAVSPTVQWQVGDWRPSPDVMSLFEGLGQQEWLDLEYGTGRNLKFCFDPDGEWPTNPDMFRTQPCRDRVEPLLAAFATALTSMPSLKDAEVFSHPCWCPSEKREIEYGIDPEDLTRDMFKWGVKYVTAHGENKTPVVQWQVGDWRPSQELGSFLRA